MEAERPSVCAEIDVKKRLFTTIYYCCIDPKRPREIGKGDQPPARCIYPNCEAACPLLRRDDLKQIFEYPVQENNHEEAPAYSYR